MYIIVNKVLGEVHQFAKISEAAKYLKEVKQDNSKVTGGEIADLCNIFAKHKNKIAINYGVSK